jgi:hypothetical protein
MSYTAGKTLSVTKGKSFEFRNTSTAELVAEITTEAGSKITAALRIGQGIVIEAFENCNFELRPAEFSESQIRILPKIESE